MTLYMVQRCLFDHLRRLEAAGDGPKPDIVTDGYTLTDEERRAVTEPDIGAIYTMTLDSKPVLVSGPAIIPMMVSAKAADDHTIETIYSREGTVTGKTILKISPDGKTLTMSS